MSTRLEGIATGLLVLSAVAIAAASVHREFFRAPLRSAATVNAPPVYVKDWERLLASGTLIGDKAAPVKIVEFSDIECPGCKVFHLKTRELPKEVRDKVAIVFIHFPLSMHKFAVPAARAAECARLEGKFESMLDELFSKQDSLGLKSWSSYALDIGIRDTSSFAQCTVRPGNVASIEAGRAMGEQLGVKGTPTVIINGWQYSSPPYDSIAAIVNRLAQP